MGVKFTCSVLGCDKEANVGEMCLKHATQAIREKEGLPPLPDKPSIDKPSTDELRCGKCGRPAGKRFNHKQNKCASCIAVERKDKARGDTPKRPYNRKGKPPAPGSMEEIAGAINEVGAERVKGAFNPPVNTKVPTAGFSKEQIREIEEQKKAVEWVSLPSDGSPLFDIPSLISAACDEIKEMLLEKNRKYGNSALNPSRVFSKASPIEQLNVRIDDKLSRIKSSQSDEDEDVEKDLIGYLVLKRVAVKIQKETA